MFKQDHSLSIQKIDGCFSQQVLWQSVRDLVFFTTQVPDTRDTSALRTTRV